MSRLTQARQAVRPALKGRILLAGPPGAGKTRTALMVAEILAEGGPVVVIDTEKESALTYADDFTFDHLGWQPPYDPRELADTIADAGTKYAVVIADSASHFWRKAGGTLDIAEGKFTGWKAARPAQEDLIDAVLDCRAHVILCARSKVEHVQEEINGKHVVRKLGMAVQQDDTLEYEMNVAADLDMEHRLTISKSRCITVPVGRFWQPGHAEEMARIYADWLKGGEPPASQKVVDGLVGRMNALPDAHRVPAKQEFVAAFGRPEHLRESLAADAETLVARWEAKPPPAGPPVGNGTRPGDAPVGDAGDGRTAAGRSPGPSNENAAEAPNPAAAAGAGDAGSEGTAAPPAGEPAPETVGWKDLGVLATRVFKADYDAAPNRQKTRTVDRLRHALIYACTDGATATAKECSAEQLFKVRGTLDAIGLGEITYRYDLADGAGVTWVSASGKERTVLWAESEMAGTHEDEGAAA